MTPKITNVSDHEVDCVYRFSHFIDAIARCVQCAVIMSDGIEIEELIERG